LSPVLMY